MKHIEKRLYGNKYNKNISVLKKYTELYDTTLTVIVPKWKSIH